jgi:hypothetical protein
MKKMMTEEDSGVEGGDTVEGKDCAMGGDTEEVLFLSLLTLLTASWRYFYGFIFYPVQDHLPFLFSKTKVVAD